MNSKNCRRELRRAIDQGKRIVFIKETDKVHGAVSMETHKRDAEVHGADLRQALDDYPVVPWYRIKKYGYAQVSLRQILKAVIGAEDEIYIPGEVLRKPLNLPPLVPPHVAHLYAPSNAQEVVELLRAEAPGVVITSDPDQRNVAQRYLLYLNGATWDNADVLSTEVATTLTEGIALLLVHEQREEGHDAVPFDTFFKLRRSGYLIGESTRLSPCRCMTATSIGACACGTWSTHHHRSPRSRAVCSASRPANFSRSPTSTGDSLLVLPRGTAKMTRGSRQGVTQGIEITVTQGGGGQSQSRPSPRNMFFGSHWS